MGSVVTVTGAVSPDEVGVALTHEHVLVDLGAYYQPDEDPLVAEELRGGLRLGNLGHLRRSLVNCLDDLALVDVSLATDEVKRFRVRGGTTICDLSSWGIRTSNQALQLQAVARDSNLLIVMGTGAYIERFHPPWLPADSIDELTALFTRELLAGVADTDCRCGVIGEVGLSTPITASESNVLDAAAQSHLATGAPIVVHQTDPTLVVAKRAVERLVRLGVAPGRIAVAHCGAMRTAEGVASLAADGVFVGIDTIGLDGRVGTRDLPSDSEYADLVVGLLDRGYAHQILLSQDVAHKRSLRSFGGRGYDHIVTDFVPLLASRGVTTASLDTMLIENPRRLLTWTV